MDYSNGIETKKKGNGITILIILLVIIILGLSCYICYDKGIIFNKKAKETSSPNTTEKKKEEKQEEPKEESVTFSESELEKYVNYISPFSYGPSKLIYDTNEVVAANLSASDKINYIGRILASKITDTPDYKFMISENDVKSTVEEVYGPNTYQETTFNLGCNDYHLNKSDGNYYSESGCGGTATRTDYNEIIDYKATKSKLEITTAYAILDGPTSKIYKDYNVSIPLDNFVYEKSPAGNEAKMKEYIKNNKNKLSTIVYTFESTNGRNYYFKGFKNNK